jgi:hypothetical protein
LRMWRKALPVRSRLFKKWLGVSTMKGPQLLADQINIPKRTCHLGEPKDEPPISFVSDSEDEPEPVESSTSSKDETPWYMKDSWLEWKCLTPKEIVEQLDKHIIGQSDAKKAVAIALRERWRRIQLEDEELRAEVMPVRYLFSFNLLTIYIAVSYFDGWTNRKWQDRDSKTTVEDCRCSICQSGSHIFH